MQSSLRRTSHLAFWVCAGAVLYLALAPVPAHVPLTHADKLHHAFAFFVLGSLGSIAWPRQVRPLLCGLLAYGVLIELLQLFTPNHQGDALDVLADLIGAVLACGLFAARRAWATRG